MASASSGDVSRSLAQDAPRLTYQGVAGLRERHRVGRYGHDMPGCCSGPSLPEDTMSAVSPASVRRRLMPVVPIAFAVLYGCADAPSPVEPHAIRMKPHALVGPTITVTNTADAGAGSLRQAIIDAPAGATIQFDAAIAGQTIVLSTGRLMVGKLLTIEGPVQSGIMISGGLSVRAFTVTTSGDLLLRNVSIVDGFEKYAGALEV